MKPLSLTLLSQILLSLHQEVFASWEEWWTYDGISGPDFWGLLNPEWRLCNRGRRQSPVDLDPKTLLFDPNLKPILVDKLRVSGTMINTGHSVIFRADKVPAPETINVTGGPLSYRYRFQEIHIHYGGADDRGSEHTVGGFAFPAEIQIFGYNSDLYQNMSQAMNRNHGLAGIAVMIQLGDLSHSELRILTSQLHKIIYKGQSAALQHLSVTELFPDTMSYMTYDGSITKPGCYETVTWVVLNRPIYITKQQLYILRKLMQGELDNPKAPIENNFRPTQPINSRVIRTNIDFKRAEGSRCPTMQTFANYQGHPASNVLSKGAN